LRRASGRLPAASSSRSLSLVAATARNALSANQAPIITRSVRMDRAENGGVDLGNPGPMTVSASNQARVLCPAET
jgi:hypothetical protein